MSTQVKSKKRHWPDFHGAIQQPSGHLPSDLHRPVGSSVDGTVTTASDLCIMALIAACLGGGGGWSIILLYTCMPVALHERNNICLLKYMRVKWS